jgi:fibro-slime domain-containing protein
VRHQFSWAFSACFRRVVPALFIGGLAACSGGGSGGASIEPQAGSGGSGPGSLGGSGGSGGSGSPSPNGGTTGFIIDSPDAGGDCVGAACGGAGGSGGAGTGTLCGNAQLDDAEQCDDGNSQAGDGCTGACNLEPNFACGEVGEPCTSTIACGDGSVAGVEACDDGNPQPGDGCSATCTVEPGFGCTTGADEDSVCIPDASVECGDSVVSSGEQCDDGDSAATDGCSSTCQVEAGFVCRTVGQPCEPIEFCGDGFLKDGLEECDDGNRSPIDGCDGSCNVLPNFVCPTPGEPCQSTIVCGDSQITGNETCDDGDTDSGDGCSRLCRAEAGFDCTGGGAQAVPGQCVAIAEPRCGDSALAASEFCDDGNTGPGDGCSTSCTIEPGWDCPSGPGSLCVQVGSCGDGFVNVLGEQCDDGDEDGGDGCTASCLREALFTCPAQGGPCVSDVECGDGLVNGPETCDDGNTLGGDGCNASCETEVGFICAVGGVCRPVCGDGIRAGREQCDDHDTSPGDGCSADCRLEQGFKCNTGASGDVCSATTCGQFGPEGTEQCDDGNLVPFDGCDELCRNEPECGLSSGSYACGAKCGDGMKFPEEACDDGNTLNDDGCSEECELEPGFVCVNEAPDLGSQIDLPVIYRDMSETHPQFEINPQNGTTNGRLPAIVASALGADGKPVFNSAFTTTKPACGGASGSRPFTMDGPTGSTSGNPTGADTGANGCNGATLNASQIASRFLEWYHDTPGVNQRLLEVLPLSEISAGTYQFAKSGSGNQFFPLDGRGLGNQGQSHNYHFTSEVRQWFEYQGGEKLEFSGDDDVWVFVNGQLTVDLGGIHGELFGSIELLGEAGEDSQLCQPGLVGTTVTCQPLSVAMDPDGVNEIAVFQAERHVTGSNYTLTLRGFNAPTTQCVSNCGDGIVTADEACDLGSAGNTGNYQTCNADCTLTARCGDGEVDAADGELCDNGINTSTRFVDGSDCAPGCVLPPSCGDGNIDGQFLEQCDDGEDNVSPGTYGACGTNCQLGPRCGDGVEQAGQGEQCDDGAENGSGGSPCLGNCVLRCGNGVVDQGEQCDEGFASNTGDYAGCESNCTFAPRCGDAVVDASAGETCDDGLNDGSYGTCAPGCVAGPFCGDGDIDVGGGEICDDGASNVVSGYAASVCTTQCRPAPFCGDQAVNTEFSEVCDDGVNDGSPGSCAANCKSAVALPSCGDGALDAGEECDHGSANGSPGDACDVRCRNACGNGFVNVTEQCDDGVNDGTYGGCKPNCTFAAFCGDGTTSGPEACDDGTSNVPAAGAYGAGVCTQSCSNAPRCGDGRVDAAFDEECDGGSGCTASCNRLR